MSLRAPSLIRLLGILQQHGLTYNHLSELVRLCRTHHSGPVTLRLWDGRIQALDAAPHAPRVALQHD